LLLLVGTVLCALEIVAVYLLWEPVLLEGGIEVAVLVSEHAVGEIAVATASMTAPGNWKLMKLTETVVDLVIAALVVVTGIEVGIAVVFETGTVVVVVGTVVVVFEIAVLLFGIAVVVGTAAVVSEIAVLLIGIAVVVELVVMTASMTVQENLKLKKLTEIAAVVVETVGSVLLVVVAVGAVFAVVEV